jgi:hypothetical protein
MTFDDYLDADDIDLADTHVRWLTTVAAMVWRARLAAEFEQRAS